MFRRMIILSIVCVCVLGGVSAGQERMPVRTDLQHQFDRNRDGFVGFEEQEMLREFSEARERIEMLLSEAREAEESARRMRAEAEEIERSLQRRFQGPQPPEALEGMRRHIAELKEAAALAEREDRGEEADQFRQQAKRIATQIDQQRNREREEAEHPERPMAERSFTEIGEFGIEIRRESPRRQPVDRAGQLDRQIAELKESAERAEREGRLDQAEKFRRQARRIAAEVNELGRGREDRRIKEQIDRMYAMAADAKAAGQYERADAIYRQAKEMERNLRNAREPKKEYEQPNRLQRQLEQLREQVNRLHREIEELKEIVRNRVEER